MKVTGVILMACIISIFVLMCVPVTPATTQPTKAAQKPVTECGGLLNGSSGSFVTPGYPSQPYPDDLNCVWTLSIPTDGFVIVEFLVFETEQRYDTVKLTDSLGKEITDPLSGSKARFYVTVEGKNTQLLNITFTSDSSIRKRGFLAQFGISLNMEVLGHWLLDGQDKNVSFHSLPLFAEGRCPGSKAAFFNQTNSFASTPIINLNDRSFTIACWIKQTAWVPDGLAAIYSDWYDPWQFLLSVKDQKIIFHRHQNGSEVRWSLESTKVSLDTWTHVAVTWDHVRHAVFIYANGQEVGNRSYTPGASFFQPTGKLYQIGKGNHTDDHQFHGSVMDLYVFGKALKLDQINKLRGVPVIINTTEEVTSRIVVVAWEPPWACPVDKYIVHYREVISLEAESNWHSVTVNRNETSYMLHLNCRKEYDVAVTSWSAHSESNLSDSKIWNFKTDRGVPVIVNTTEEVTSGIVVVAWEPLCACPVDKYIVHYREVIFFEVKSNWHTVTVNRNETSYMLHLSCRKEYDVAVTSWNAHSESNLSDSKIWNFKTGGADKNCLEVDWQIALSRQGWANCSCSGSYLTGLWRENDFTSSPADGIDNIKRGKCCFPPHEYEDDIPDCHIEDWKTKLSKNNKWASCPDGYFLQGFYRSTDVQLHNIEQALCCRPRNFANIDMARDCYDEDVRLSLDKEGWSKCKQAWYYMVGVYKGGCDDLHCIEMIRCCRMRLPDMPVLGHWLLNGQDELLSFNSVPLFAEGRCPGSKAAFFNQTNSFARTPKIDLTDQSFTIACWLKQTTSVPNKLAAIYGDWYYPWQFLLSIVNQKIIFHRHQDGKEKWFSLGSTNVSLDTWTHVAVTWDLVKRALYIYADGKEIGYRSFQSEVKFYGLTGKLYQIGNTGGDNQFHGSIMDLYVFGTALTLGQINKLRGVPEIVNSTKAVPGGTVVVAWKPPLEGACPVITYTVYYRKAAKKSKWQSVTVKGKTDSYTLQLKCKEEYEVAVTSLSGFMESTFNEIKIWNFKTQGEVPSIPVIKNKETETPRCDVILTWSPPADNGCPLTMYTINYQRIQPREIEEPWYQVNLTDIMTTNFTISLSCDTQYKIEISAWNELGESERSRPWIIKTLQSDKNKETSKGLSATQLSALIGGLCALLIVISMLIFALRRKAKRRKRRAHNLRPRRSKSTIFALRRWEVLPEQVVFKEEIGRGAFGMVFKATFKESPGIEVFYKPRTQTVDWKKDRIVAVKVLEDTTEEESRNQFLEEIELMKAIGSHRNIVSMLGCCVNSDPIFLVLEYVPYGDLLHWLRNKRIQKSYQKNYSNEENRLRLAASKVQFSTDMDNESKQLLTGNEKKTMDLSKLNVEAAGKEKEAEEIKPEMKEGVENHLEAQPVRVTQSGCHDNVQREEEFNVKDLLSFAWQIARGMNFLSSNGFVHRDLAARNVLLGEDKVVKISDFGLMRQTHENVYHLKKGKKIPVKWMAPEALYNSEYTTKSDVWSFGILLWELSTMGGNPYPGINNKELYNLLKTGYRMEQPNTCSDKLFELVLTCWKDEPSERPTFESATRSLEEMMQKDAPYLDLESLDESKAYYCSEKLSEDDVTV